MLVRIIAPVIAAVDSPPLRRHALPDSACDVHGPSHYRKARSSITVASTPPAATATPSASAPVDLSPANTQFAPVRSTAESSPSLERHVGELVASAAAAVAEALREFERGKLTGRTKSHGGDLIFELYKLRMFMVGYWDFDRIAVEYGRAVLRETSGSEVDARTIHILVYGVMDILRKVTRAAAN